MTYRWVRKAAQRKLAAARQTEATACARIPVPGGTSNQAVAVILAGRTDVLLSASLRREAGTSLSPTQRVAHSASVNFSWYRDLYKIGSVAGMKAVVVRVTLAVGIPLLGGVLIGHRAAGVAGGATALFVTLSDIGTTRAVRLGTMFAGWLAIVVGATLGHLLSGTPYGRESIVLLGALVAGWASGSHPGIAAVTRFFAIAAAAGAGMHFTDPDVLLSLVVAGITAP